MVCRRHQIRVSWQPTAGDATHSQCASQEVELLGPRGAAVRQSCAPDRQECQLSGDLPAGTCEVLQMLTCRGVSFYMICGAVAAAGHYIHACEAC